MCGLEFSVLILIASAVVTASPLHQRYLRGIHYTVDSDAPSAARKPYVETHNATYHGAGPREEARAMCSVRTQEVNATANATITRRLHGVVTSSTTARDRGWKHAPWVLGIRTQEVNATNSATITRRLHVVVTSRELHNAIQRLELIIFGQMQQLWQSLDALRSQLAGNAHTSYPDRRTISFRYQPDIG